MRTTILFFALVMLSFFSLAGENITGKSNTMLDNYVITPAGENLYQLTYSKSNEVFTIEVCHNMKECCYLLRGNAIEVMYVCSNLGFGMRRMPERYKKLDCSTYKHLINTEAFNQQSVLSERMKKEHDALGLIACFFPLVIKEESFPLVFNYDPKDNIELTVK